MTILHRVIRTTSVRLLPCRAFSTTSEKGTIKLGISNPMAILNAVANSYESTNRILMEFVDNAIDAADDKRHVLDDAGKIQTSGAIFDYPHHAQVHVNIDHAQRNIWIRDNGVGIPQHLLGDIATRVGDSKKKTCSWLNGQFGFGMQSFRAAATRMSIYSVTDGSSPCKFAILRSDTDAVSVPFKYTEDDEDVLLAKEIGLFAQTGDQLLVDDAKPGKQTGTSVLLGGFDPLWFTGVTAKSVSEEIQSHFESMLWRGNFTVVVTEKGKANGAFKCIPFDYSKVEGHHITDTLTVQDKKESSELVCDIVVTKSVVRKKRVRFFAHGRRINFASDLKSFMKISKHGAALWDHPSVCGIIEVGDTLNPVITRDEFTYNRKRTLAYNELLKLEDDLMMALNSVIQAQVNSSMYDLENVLRSTVSGFIRRETKVPARRGDEGAFQDLDADTFAFEDDRESEQVESDGQVYETIANPRVDRKDTEPKQKDTEPKAKTKTGAHVKHQYGGWFDVRFVSQGEDNAGAPRSFLSAHKVYINTDHADFKTRIDKDSQGRPVLGQRIAAYLAAELSSYYQAEFYTRTGEKVPKEQSELYKDMLHAVHGLESVLSKKVKTLSKTIKSGRQIS